MYYRKYVELPGEKLLELHLALMWVSAYDTNLNCSTEYPEKEAHWHAKQRELNLCSWKLTFPSPHVVLMPPPEASVTVFEPGLVYETFSPGLSAAPG